MTHSIASQYEGSPFLKRSEKIQLCHRYDLAEPLTHECLQRLLYDFYAQTRLSPGYLFLSEQDHAILSEEVRRNCDNSIYPWHIIVSEFGFDECPNRFAFSGVRRLCNRVNGEFVRVVPLPDLESGTVIVGFFR